jgi:hypothetical protein
MAMTPYGGNTDVIAALGTTPQERGLDTPQFKAKFDEGLKNFVAWFNDTHKTEFDAKADTDDIPEIPDTIMTTDEDQTMTADLIAKSGTDYTARRVRNIILSDQDADPDLMQNGDIWIKYTDEE